MYKKSNLFLILAILCFASSCKSESKGKIEATIPTESVNEIVESTPAVEEVKVEATTEVPKEVEEKSTPTATKKIKEESKSVSKVAEEKIAETSSKVKTKVEEIIPNNTAPVNTPKKAPIKVEDVIVKEVKTEPTKIKDPVVKTDPIVETKPEKIVKEVVAPNHKVFDGLLKAHVSSSGKVNYAGFKSDVSKLDSYLSELESADVSSMSKNEKLAFWINAYNANTIKLILNNYPVNSITDLYAGKPWDHKWIKIDGKTLSLNNIENDIIRPTFKEPRIHFAVNCAARSCPPLLNAAYTSSALEGQLESQTKKFINNSGYNTLGSDQITISKIFDWYGVDFGDVAAFVSKYSNASPSAKITFNEYNWALNN